jgi:hypothetical protein
MSELRSLVQNQAGATPLARYVVSAVMVSVLRATHQACLDE